MRYKRRGDIEAIQWNGDNLKEVLEFVGKDPRFSEWFNSFEEYEEYVKSHDNIFKIFHKEYTSHVYTSDYIIKECDGDCVSLSKKLFEPQYEPI
jgi:hypothetical protein